MKTDHSRLNDARASEVKAEYAAGMAAMREGIEHFRRAGVLLAEVRQQTAPGQWLVFLNEAEMSQPTAWRLLQLARLSESEIKKFSSMTEALNYLHDADLEAEIDAAIEENQTVWAEFAKSMDQPVTEEDLIGLDLTVEQCRQEGFTKDIILVIRMARSKFNGEKAIDKLVESWERRGVLKQKRREWLRRRTV